MTNSISAIDCSACNSERTMEATKISKFNGILRFIGFIIIIPSLLGVLFAVMLFFMTGAATNEVMTAAQSEAQKAGAGLGFILGGGFAVFMGAASLVSGFIGWVLIMKKKVFKCISCGFILNRD